MKYSDKENVNILTSLLVAHGVGHAVVCPGSRNVPIVHNLSVCKAIICHPVTDERSAGFYALGLSQALRTKVAVCVTSGSALLNLLPAVAEACYQRLPLVVISADRPPQWIDQQDGQTIPQCPVSRFFAKEVTLPEPVDAEQRWLCNRLVNETMMVESRPVHINVPISEPLFNFTTPQLPRERVVRVAPRPVVSCLAVEVLWEKLTAARRPLIVIGQLAQDTEQAIYINKVAEHFALAAEPLSVAGFTMLDEAVAAATGDTRYVPDMVVYGGGHIVSKRMKQFLRQAKDADMWQISEDGELCDTFQHTTHVLHATVKEVVKAIAVKLSSTENVQKISSEASAYRVLWSETLAQLRQRAVEEQATWSKEQATRDDGQATRDDGQVYSQESIVRHLESKLAASPTAVRHYANSMSVRLGCSFAGGYVYCNRGVNGIEGSLSTAAGFSLATDNMVVCVIGDLSFFYDQNALWNSQLGGNLRILLLNNGGGGIFERFDGLKASPARNNIVMASHQTSAEGICLQHDIYYQRATTAEEAARAIDLLLTTRLSRPMVVECEGF